MVFVKRLEVSIQASSGVLIDALSNNMQQLISALGSSLVVFGRPVQVTVSQKWCPIVESSREKPLFSQKFAAEGIKFSVSDRLSVGGDAEWIIPRRVERNC